MYGITGATFQRLRGGKQMEKIQLSNGLVLVLHLVYHIIAMSTVAKFDGHLTLGEFSYLSCTV